jgi:Fe-S-cluster containining protein
MVWPVPLDPVDYVEKLHATVDDLVAPLEHHHQERLQCGRGCADCCIDGLTVFPVEAEVIRRHHAALLEEGLPAPPGGCAFLDDADACRIYPQRPYVCRTQGLPLRWAEEEGDEVVERRDICPLNAGGPSLATLPAETMWTLGPVERRLAAAQAQYDDPETRVPLRALFRTSS